MCNKVRRLTMLLACALLFGVFASAAELNGYYLSDDGGAYFIRQIGDKVYWFGEDPAGAYANVLIGTISGSKITARYWDVPKGKTQGLGEITLTIQDNGAMLVKVSSTSPFGTKTLKKQTPHAEGLTIKGFPPEMRSRPQGFSGGEQNLTGVWQGDDAAFYYVRETPTDIVWVAENNQWGGDGGTAQPSFVHVFFGKKINKLVTGNWVDLPKGKAASSGVLGLGLASPQEMNSINPPEGIYMSRLWRSLPNSLRGFADLHAHPMVNLGFGGKLVHGGVDIGSLLTIDAQCKHNVRANGIAEALDRDNGTHGGTGWFGADNPCGDNLRQAIIDAFQEQNHADVTPDNAVGFPSFKDWPRWDDITHQKMWVDWIRRSYASGQRVMVALAVNNYTIAAGVSGPGDGPTDDKASADLQIKEIISFVGRHNDFMEVAKTPEDLRRIVSQNKMAIILGVEIDNIGNFNKVGGSGPMTYDEVQHLYNEGVRYAFPIHLINNKFGGTAIYQDVFNLSNYHVTGKFWDIQCANAGEGIKHKFVVDGFDFPLAGAKATKLQVDIARNPPDPPKCGNEGHRNSLGLTDMGKRAVDEMMARGMLIDIDHMSEFAVEDTLEKAEAVPGGYPLVSGHNSIRSMSKDPNENNRTIEQLERIAKLGGMFGLGSDGVKATDYLDAYITASKVGTRFSLTGAGPQGRVQTLGNGRVAFGTDLNGLVKGPRPPVSIDIQKPLPPQFKACPDIYDTAFVQSKTGDRSWNYCTEGVAHYGMLPDFLKHLFGLPQGDFIRDNIMKNAEMFAEMWEKAIKNGKAK
jgi:microsomal dipeptidase-like Zn-dependent dipeptidase